MQLYQLKAGRPNKSKKPRVGRGGKRGTFSGRGTKGQKARAGRRIRPAERDYIQRLPKLRGYKNKPLKIKTRVVNVGNLEFKVAGNIVDFKTLPGIDKILGEGEIKRALTVKGIKVSASARKKIEAAGGIIVNK